MRAPRLYAALPIEEVLERSGLKPSEWRKWVFTGKDAQGRMCLFVLLTGPRPGAVLKGRTAAAAPPATPLRTRRRRDAPTPGPTLEEFSS